MAVTKTESIISLLNYNLTSRQSTSPDKRVANDSFSTAMRHIVDVFANGVKSGVHTQEEVEDFNEHLSTVKYLDNSNLYPGLETLVPYSRQVTAGLVEENVNGMVR